VNDHVGWDGPLGAANDGSGQPDRMGAPGRAGDAASLPFRRDAYVAIDRLVRAALAERGIESGVLSEDYPVLVAEIYEACLAGDPSRSLGQIEGIAHTIIDRFDLPRTG